MVSFLFYKLKIDQTEGCSLTLDHFRHFFKLGRFNNMPGFDTICADHYFFNRAIRYGPYTLQVRVKTTFGHIMSMTDVISDHWLFAADLTDFRHLGYSFCAY